ncbi:MAG: glycosyltransferase family 39 protein [Lentisphaeria bacterium]|nr:glycosyltransferase family 39 protein [Lentisphaeria bacterium]
MRAAEPDLDAGKDRSSVFFVRSLTVIALAAWLLRLAAAWEMSRAGNGVGNMFTPPPTSDLATYMTLGRACAAGDFPTEFYYQPYYYAVFLAAIYRMFGGAAVYAVIVIQSILSAATVFLTGWCARKVFSERAGLLAAALTAVSSSLILYVPFHQNETLQTFHLILLFALTLRAGERQSPGGWFAVGGVTGIAILTRGNVWLLVPVIAGFLIRRRPKGPRGWLFPVIFAVSLLAVQLPFILRNSVSAGALRGPSTAADAVLALGNGADAPAGGRNPGETAGAMYYSESYRRMMANTRGEYARSVPAQMRDWLTADPWGFAELQFRKALLFWDGREIPNNVSLEYDGAAHSLILRYLLCGRNHILLALGLAGMLWFIPTLRRERRGELPLLYGFTVAFYLTVVMFYILSRFKAPLLPFLAIFGGGGLCAWAAAWRRWRAAKQWRPAAGAAAVLLASCWVSSRAYDCYRACEAGIQRAIHPDGICLDMNGPNLMYFDHGPAPWGDWREVPLRFGMRIGKTFAVGVTAPVELQIMMRNAEAATVGMIINGGYREWVLPPPAPGRSERKFVILPAILLRGRLELEVVKIQGGDVRMMLDAQRNYGRSALNGETVAGEWVIRVGIPRNFP